MPALVGAVLVVLVLVVLVLVVLVAVVRWGWSCGWCRTGRRPEGAGGRW